METKPEKIKSKLFSASLRCPICGKAIQMRISDDKNYTYQCLDCHKHFHAAQCPDTVSDLYEITLHGQSATWFQKHKNVLQTIAKKYNIVFLGCDDGGNTNPDQEALIDFGWEENPTDTTIHAFTENIINQLQKN